MITALLVILVLLIFMEVNRCCPADPGSSG